MDAVKFGKRIAELRKQKGLTQKELAAGLHVTDGAVSKWERGINFPDLALMQPLAAALDSSVIQLLELEDATNQEVANTMSALSAQEKEGLRKELKLRAILNIAIGLILLACLVTASILFKNHNIYGLAQGVTMGAIGFVATMIASELFLLCHIGKI